MLDEVALRKPEKGRSTHLHVVGFARSGTTILMDILNASDDVLMLSEFNYHIVRRFPNAFYKYGGATAYDHFANRKQEELHLIHKGAHLNFHRGEEPPLAELFDTLNHDYRLTGDKIAVSDRQFGEVSEQELLAEFIAANENSRFLFTIRRPDDTLRSWLKLFPNADLEQVIVRLARTWAVILSGYFIVKHPYLVFHREIKPALVDEIEGTFNIKCNVSRALVADIRRYRRRDRYFRKPIPPVSGLPELSKWLEELYEIFECDKTVIKRSRTGALAIKVARVLEKIEDRFGPFPPGEKPFVLR
jgi:hypothetical protein